MLESLVRLSRTQAHDKAEEYSVALDEVKARQASLESGHLQRLIFSGDIPLRSISQGAPPFVAPLPPPDLMVSRPGLADLALLRFYDPSHFRAGNNHGKSYVWQNLIPNSPCEEVVRVEHFFRPFRGNFKWKTYDSNIPPLVVIHNSATCAKFTQFVSDTIVQWVIAGVLAVWGPVNLAAPPYLVLPLTVEPTKPRLCHDKRYLNLWIRDRPFKLDQFPRYVHPNHLQTTFDDKNGYQRVLLHSSSQAYFDFQWEGFYFVFRTLPFGWKASAFIYHKLDLAVSAPLSPLGFQCRNTLTTGTWVSFSPLHFS